MLCISSSAQEPEDSTFVRPGLVRAFGCFAFDYRMNQKVWDYSLHGFAEYFPEKNISVMGELYYYLDSNTDFPLIRKQLSIVSGFAYHWPKKRFDPYVGISAMGNLCNSQVMTDSGTVLMHDVSGSDFNPGLILSGGMNLYVWKYLNFFVQVRYKRTFIYSPIQITNMDAFSISYGLGINFNTPHRKNKPN